MTTPRPSRYYGPTTIPQRVIQPAPPAFFLFSSTTYSASEASTNSVHRCDNDDFNCNSPVPICVRPPPTPRRDSQQNLPIRTYFCRSLYHLEPYGGRQQHEFRDESQDTPKGRSSQFNSPKLVCKQLHAETAGLEIQFNCVIFTPSGGSGKTAEHAFFDFVALMTLKKMDWLSTVIIATNEKCLSATVTRSPDLPHLPALVSFAKHHPTIDIRYQFATSNSTRPSDTLGTISSTWASR
jgi:hypothetical protein